jgi:uncharacterized protein YbjT (DUF2867 family)
MDTKRVILTGATGMIGGLILRYCLENEGVSEVTVIGRRSVEIQNPKLSEVLHDDYADYSEVSEEFKGQHIAFFCIGVYTGAVPDDEFRKITVDYAHAFGSTVRARSPEAVLCFLGGAGTDPKEKSRIAFARYKGMAENSLLRMGFPRIHLFRPGYIYPVTPRDEPNIWLRIFRSLYPAVRRVYPNIGIASDDLARVMVHAGLHGTGAHTDPVLENRDIRALAESAR